MHRRLVRCACRHLCRRSMQQNIARYTAPSVNVLPEGRSPRPRQRHHGAIRPIQRAPADQVNKQTLQRPRRTPASPANSRIGSWRAPCQPRRGVRPLTRSRVSIFGAKRAQLTDAISACDPKRTPYRRYRGDILPLGAIYKVTSVRRIHGAAPSWFRSVSL